jgi:DNA-binding beta-propeller fold protein YncE
MQRMKREVSPVLGVVLVLAALTTAQVLYWRGLIGAPYAARPDGMHGRVHERAKLPAGLEEVMVVTAAGRPEPGKSDGMSEEARFDGPAAVATDGSVVYVADSKNHCVREVSASGEVTTVAGRPGEAGYADGAAVEARFSSPAGVAVAADGSLLVADTGNHRLRRIRGGTVATIAGAATTRDDLGRELGGYRDGPAEQAQFCYPVGLAADDRGGLYVADAGNHRVRYLSASGEVTTVGTDGNGRMNAPTALALAADGQLWVADTAAGALWSGPGQGPVREWKAGEGSGLGKPAGLAVTGEGAAEAEIYVADCENHCLFRMEENQLTLVAGLLDPHRPGWQDGGGNVAQFYCPAGIAAAADGSIYVADFGNNCLRRVSGPGYDPPHNRQANRRGRRGGAPGGG